MSEPRDLEASLAEMDRKLRELQRELELVSRAEPDPAPGPAPAPPPAPEVERVVEEAAARVSELGRRIDELAMLRDDLDRATQALRAEYRAARPAPAARELVVDAGPFTDIATLGAFEQALGQVVGVEDAVVRSFEGNRALVDVRASPDLDVEAALESLSHAHGGALDLRLRSGE